MEGYNPTKLKSGVTIWLTGLSGAGKTTIAHSINDQVSVDHKESKCFILDGDIIRKGLNKDLGFSKEDREENISGHIVIVAFISPFEKDRQLAKELHREASLPFYEVYVSTSLEVCEKRDVKGLYAKARKGEILNFTGISSPYEAPSDADIVIDTANLTVFESTSLILNKLEQEGFLAKNPYVNEGFRVIEKSFEYFDGLTALEMDEEELNILQILQQGWAPQILKCFMNEKQLLECLYFKTISESGLESNLNISANKHLQSIPLICPITKEESELIHDKDKILLVNKINKEPIAIIHKPSFYPFRKEEICSKLFGTNSLNHPKTNKYYSQGDFLLTGETFEFINKIHFNDGLDNFRLSSKEIRNLITEKNADIVFAFQLRNPLHNGHCLLLEQTRLDLIEKGYKNPLLLLHPCGGWTKDDDVPLEARVRQHQALIDAGALNKDSTILAIWPSPMFYAGPLEVLWHFSSREFAGVDLMIVGRDPAGIKHPDNPKEDLYDPTHGHKILNQAYDMKLLKVKISEFRLAVYNKEEKRMEFFKPENKEKYENISGSLIRELIRNGQDAPEGYMHPDGWKILAEYYKSLEN